MIYQISKENMRYYSLYTSFPVPFSKIDSLPTTGYDTSASPKKSATKRDQADQTKPNNTTPELPNPKQLDFPPPYPKP